jgi:monovalent cation/hydrogen antiporter
MANLETLIVLMFIAAILVGVAQKVHIPYPITLVLGGIFIGFTPGIPAISFDPNLILVLVLPPILYNAAFGISFREFKKNWRYIFSLALGLVFVTTFVIGITFKWIFPDLPWPLAFAFGAIVSPPDASAASSILKKFDFGPKLLTILEGESLINDASALVLYKMAVVALLSGEFSFAAGGLEFIKTVSGGIVVGFIAGIIFQHFSRLYLDPIVGVVFSFTIPYMVYTVANLLEVSGVLAVVICGLIGSNVLHKHHSSLRRVVGYATWDIFIILLNCFVFILIGLHLSVLTSILSVHKMVQYSSYGLLITFIMIVVRMAWVYATVGISNFKGLIEGKDVIPLQTIKNAALIGWSGMRGIVSLAAALALPLTLSNGKPLEGRDEVIFITFVVILLSLLIPGFTLPSFISWLKIHSPIHHNGAPRIRKLLAKAAEEEIENFYSEKIITNEEFNFLKKYFSLQRQVLEISTSEHKRLQKLENIRLLVIRAQRKRLLKMWENTVIDDKLLNFLEHELDIEEIHIARAEIK